MSLRQAAEMALEALEGVAQRVEKRPNLHPWDAWQRVEPAITALRAALAETEEPVAWGYETATGLRLIHWLDRCDTRQLQNDQEAARLYPTGHRVWPLYAHPPRREPLTMEQLAEIIERGDVAERREDGTGWYVLPYSLARAIERAHGIGGDE